jgi:hypothetical protein
LVLIARAERDAAGISSIKRTKEHPAVIHPMQYDLERAYHVSRQRSAAQQRFVAEAERQSVDSSTSGPRADGILGRFSVSFVRRVHALALPRRQVA